MQRGDIVKLDCGACVDGYSSDGCRHACLGAPTLEQRIVYNALVAGFGKGLSLIGPGRTMRDVYEAAISVVRDTGLPNYSRGHFGHSIGLDDQTEEPPFIGPSDAVLEPGMVVYLELPYYPSDLGGFNIEDMLLITDDGHEVMTRCDRDFRKLTPDMF